MACKVHEKKTRASPASIVVVRPSAAGMIWNSSSMAAPTADRRPRPQVRPGHVGEHRQRHRGARIGTLPDGKVHRHQRDPDPRADHHQHDADVVERVADHRRVEGVQHRGEPERHRDHRRHGAGRHQREPGPGPPPADHRPLQRRLGDGVAEAHRDQGREHVGHRRAVRRDGAVVPVRVADPGRERATDEHLPFAQRQRHGEPRESEPEMREDQAPTVQHSSTSVDRLQAS